MKEKLILPNNKARISIFTILILPLLLFWLLNSRFITKDIFGLTNNKVELLIAYLIAMSFLYYIIPLILSPRIIMSRSIYFRNSKLIFGFSLFSNSIDYIEFDTSDIIKIFDGKFSRFNFKELFWNYPELGIRKTQIIIITSTNTFAINYDQSILRFLKSNLDPDKFEQNMEENLSDTQPRQDEKYFVKISLPIQKRIHLGIISGLLLPSLAGILIFFYLSFFDPELYPLMTLSFAILLIIFYTIFPVHQFIIRLISSTSIEYQNRKLILYYQIFGMKKLSIKVFTFQTINYIIETSAKYNKGISKYWNLSFITINNDGYLILGNNEIFKIQYDEKVKVFFNEILKDKLILSSKEN